MSAMKTIGKLGLALGVFAAMSYAETWTGKLIDYSCQERSQQNPAEKQQPQTSGVQACEPTASTTSFGIQTSDGKVYKLDSAGDAKASTALKGRSDTKGMTATVSGTMEGQTVKVDTISVR